MSLLDSYNKLQKEGFKAGEDKINEGFTRIPAGEYVVSADVISHYVNTNSGFQALSFTFEVVDGEHAGSKELVFINLDDTKKDGTPLPEFVIAKNLKLLMTLGAVLGVNITNEMLAGDLVTIYTNLVNVFIPKKGSLLNMEISEAPNKKDSENPYRNYEFSKYVQPQTNLDLPTDDDMPF